ncbi:hypothetical protein NLJ89_g4196 [Agrocybe chaxingu]|uniref:P-loop containing nucleoside triphosphate hydrolase protein n=1 Tax=Agrocybe chaxingu TaxID=84603 RepID=A0A9W8KA16_9AGAR|nr:hypothetical protein NLJ89_g4196 [Agrocybe chaxingu]
MGEYNTKTRVILVGVGGATCSGKTTLAKHLKRILPDSVIIHQDDFAPPQELVPVHPIHKVQDWDAPAGAISWDRLIQFLRHVKQTGEIPPDHRSHDHLNEQKEIRVDEEVRDRWVSEFERLKKERGEKGEKIVWGLVDGFLLYWHKIVYPAYLEAHEEVFENGDVENGKPTEKVKDLILLESLDISMTEAVERCCAVLKEVEENA